MNPAPTPSQMKAAKRYFSVVGLLSLIWLAMFINSHPEWVQEVKEHLNLVPKLHASEESFYNSRIDPIFEKYCVACHDDNKDKGQLRLDSFRQLTFSGRSEADLTIAQNNLLIERMTLPATDRLAMPPYGRERHSDQELALIKMWLAKGGSGQMTEEDFPDAPAKAKVIKFGDIDWRKIEDMRAPDLAQVQALQQAFPHKIQYLARTSNLLTVNFSLQRPKVEDSDVAKLSAISHLIASINLSGSAISDSVIDTLITMAELTEIKLSDTTITEQTLLAVAELPKLNKVFVDGEKVSPLVQQAYNSKGITMIPVNKR